MKLLTVGITVLLGIQAAVLAEIHRQGTEGRIEKMMPLLLHGRSPGSRDLVSRSPISEAKPVFDIQSAPILSRAVTPKAEQSPSFKALKKRVRLAHGAIMGIVFLGLYPFAAIMMRLFNFRYILLVHIGIQIFAMLLMYVGLGLGIWFAEHDDQLFNSLHTKMGIVIPSLMLLQPFFGYLHHRGFVKAGGRNVMTFLHANYGRILVFLGGVNGILGRVNEGDYAHGQTIFAALFGIVCGIYLVTWALTAYTRRRGSYEANGTLDSNIEPVSESKSASAL